MSFLYKDGALDGIQNPDYSTLSQFKPAALNSLENPTYGILNSTADKMDNIYDIVTANEAASTEDSTANTDNLKEDM